MGTTRLEIWRLLCRNMRSIDGESMDDPDAWAEAIAKKVHTPPFDPLECELLNGEWRLLSRYPTPEGGLITITTSINKIKSTENALRKSEAHFRRIVEGHPLPVNIVDKETGELIYASPSATALFGYDWPSAEPIKIANQYADPADRAPFLEKLHATGEVRGYEIRAKKLDGSEFWVQLNSQLTELDGRPVIVSTFNETTKAKQREIKLRQAQETLEDAIESLDEGFALFDADDRLLMCNSQYRDFHKVSADIIKPGMTWVELMRADLDKGLFVNAVGREDAWLKDRIAARREVRRNMEYQQSDGRWIIGSNTRTRDGGIVVTLRDITERKKTETEAREARQMLEDAIESLPEGFVIWDKDDYFVMCNQRYREINRISESVLKPGITWKEFVRKGPRWGNTKKPSAGSTRGMIIG